EVATLTNVARPHLALITCIAPAHVEGLGGLDGIRAEKLTIAEGLVEGGVLFVNGDDPALVGAAVARRDVEVRSWGFGEHCELRGREPAVTNDGVSLRLSPEGPRIEAALLGRHNLSNLLAASVLARALGLTEDEIAAGARQVRPTPLRMERRQVGDWLVIFDCYNANPGSMTAALDELVRQPVVGRRVAILGDMLELGSDSEGHHRDLGRRLAGLGLDAVVFVGSAMRRAQAAAAKAGADAANLHAFDDARACRSDLLSLLRDRDTVLLKGSRGMVLETIFDAEIGA
ncbi:MAG: UDP-N-acetylmuramoyl-tripeptide--D-alanyl-D-alanine ligase, partial [Planctomycetes bacterium]|nr:UDP-N-acetylmuramoyl-tripeptide--D-alanyl-D-alanine ligase [Planctomycetota bacterium]